MNRIDSFPMKADLKKFTRRVPLTLKMIVAVIASGLFVSVLADYYLEQVVTSLFKSHLQSMLDYQAQEDRLRFDHYLKNFTQVVKITASQKKLYDYLDIQKWFRNKSEFSVVRHSKADWLPGNSILRALAMPRLVLLLDEKGKTRGAFYRHEELFPDSIIHPDHLLIEKSKGQTHITVEKGRPFIVSSESVSGPGGINITLFMASPIDEQMLLAAQSDFPKRLVALLSPDGERVIVSNNRTLIPPNIAIAELKDDFVMTGRFYHDYGGAEMVVRISSFIPRVEIDEMARIFINAEKRERAISSLIFVFVFMLIIFWVTRRIRKLTRQVEQFSRQALGSNITPLPGGDKLEILVERFQLLASEVINSHIKIHEEAEAHTAHVLELERQKKLYSLLRAVTDAMNVGVMVSDGENLKAMNDIMHELQKQYVDLEVFDVESGKVEERVIDDRAGEGRIFRLSSPELYENEKVVLISDITDKRKAEEEREKLQNQLAHVQRMESIGRLAGGVAHDFNNILSAINGYIYIGLLKMAEDDPNRKILNSIYDAGMRAGELTGQLLAFSRRQITNPKAMNINRSIENLMKMLHRLIGEDVDIQFIKKDELWNIMMDKVQLDQIIMNLAVNARDAMPDGGRLTIQTDDLTIKGSEASALSPDFIPGEYVRLSITDNGVGISPEHIDHIFEPFFTTKDQGKGTGLGLAMVYGIVKQNKGYIYVVSKASQGTTLNIYLPRSIEQEEEIDILEDESLPRGSETILLAEDQDDVRMMAVMILSELGYTVIEAADGREAFEMFEKYHGRINLLLTDVVMPKTGGYELARLVHEKYPDVNILFMTGYTNNALMRHGFYKNIQVLQKPLTAENLAKMVRKVLDEEVV